MTVITVCYNAVKSIEETICSVINQSYSDVEYILIDGGSTDGTVEVIRKYSTRITKWISEPDKGIYDAMNKGIEFSHGDWIMFINSGDTLANEEVLEKIFSQFYSESIGVLYGDVILAYVYGRVVAKPFPLEEFEHFFPFSHPASFVQGNLLRSHKFDLKYKIVSDYNLFYQLYKKGIQFKYIPVSVSVFEAETGISSRQFLTTFREVSQINGEYIKNGWKIKYLIFTLKRTIIELCKSLVPIRIRQRILFSRLLKGNHITQL
ncbi:glycosyltransferase family 2 protein [Bacteroides sp.]|uniref:glycosyltransferase family 2 protein n=1 Tax=Bacteroides sp. TaxID=29523 RepID=UPI00262322EC|nr:glycosyltransferase family 2 protein [Bacteroides sp.]MDD3037276.1 glycosyltransferase family 2 protein [Bacteroides sp.]